VIKNLLPADLLKVYRDRFVALANNEVERPPMMTLMRDVTIAKRKDVKGEDYISKIQDYEDDPVLFTYCQRPEVLRYITCFCGPDVKSVHTMLINKPPHAGATGRHPLHQDLHYFPFRPANRIACAWTALEPVTRANGCLVVLPGTHKGELLEHGYPDWEGSQNALYHGVKNVPQEAKRVYVEMDPGDTVFFHPILIHGSGVRAGARPHALVRMPPNAVAVAACSLGFRAPPPAGQQDERLPQGHLVPLRQLALQVH